MMSASSPEATYPPRSSQTQGPVVIGGVGGSGTRVVVEIMRRLGVYTGSDLNKAGDNKWFTLLCKLPRWELDPVARREALLSARSTSRAGDDGPARAPTANDRRSHPTSCRPLGR